MLPNRRLNNNPMATASLLGLAVVLALGGSATNAIAALGDVGFTLRISEKERVLQTTWEVDQLGPGEQILLPGMVDPVNPQVYVDMAHKDAMWDSAQVRRAARMMPFVEITNLASSTGNLTEFRMSIGDTAFNFSNALLGVYVTPGVMDSLPINVPDLDFSIASATVVTDQGALLGDELLITFGNGGLAPGETARFRVYLAADAGNTTMPDFREIFGNANAQNFVDPTDDFDTNSVFSAVFRDPNDPTMTVTTDPAALADFTLDGPAFLNSSSVLRPYSAMEPVQIFGGSSLGGPTLIPEPSTIVLGLGAALMGWGARRQLRRKQACA